MAHFLYRFVSFVHCDQLRSNLKAIHAWDFCTVPRAYCFLHIAFGYCKAQQAKSLTIRHFFYPFFIEAEIFLYTEIVIVPFAFVLNQRYGWDGLMQFNTFVSVRLWIPFNPTVLWNFFHNTFIWEEIWWNNKLLNDFMGTKNHKFHLWILLDRSWEHPRYVLSIENIWKVCGKHIRKGDEIKSRIFLPFAAAIQPKTIPSARIKNCIFTLRYWHWHSFNSFSRKDWMLYL